MFLMLIIIFAIVFCICVFYLLTYKLFSHAPCINTQIYKFYTSCCSTKKTNKYLTHYYINDKSYKKKICDSSPMQQRHIGDYINIRHLRFCPKISMRHKTFNFMTIYKQPVTMIAILSLAMSCIFLFFLI